MCKIEAAAFYQRVQAQAKKEKPDAMELRAVVVI
jgi:hypothetical protein